MRWCAGIVAASMLACGWPSGGDEPRAPRRGAAPREGAKSGKRADADWIERVSLQSGGVQRTAWLHVPAEVSADRKPPLLLGFHGGKGDDGERMAAQWDHLADQGLVMVFPDGLGTGERAWAGPDDRRDVQFTTDLIAWVDGQVGVDRSRVYAAGFSNGSGFTWMLECFSPELFAGFGHVQQSMANEVLAQCRPSQHVPTIWLHGDADEKAVWDGNDGTIGVPRTMQFWLDFHRCTVDLAVPTALPDLPGDDTHVTRTVYPTCQDVAAVELFRIHGGTHKWPTQQPSRDAAGKSHDVDASLEMVRFWREHARL